MSSAKPPEECSPPPEGPEAERTSPGYVPQKTCCFFLYSLTQLHEEISALSVRPGSSHVSLLHCFCGGVKNRFWQQNECWTVPMLATCPNTYIEVGASTLKSSSTYLKLCFPKKIFSLRKCEIFLAEQCPHIYNTICTNWNFLNRDLNKLLYKSN